MKVQFEWQVGGDEDDEWETIANRQKKQIPRWARLSIRYALIVLIVLAAAGYGFVRFRYEMARRRAGQEIEQVMDLEARTFGQRDNDRFLAQQDDGSQSWIAQQQRCLSQQRDTNADAPLIIDRYLCAPLQPVRIEHLDLWGEIASIETIEGQPPVRVARTYRKTTRGWLHTWPRPAHRGDPVEERHGLVTVHFYEDDRPHIDPILAHIAAISDANAALLEYSAPSGRLKITFSSTPPRSALPIDGDQLVLLSPWSSGIPVDGTWSEAYLDSVTYRVAYALALRATKSAGSHGSSRLQQTMAAEYAKWFVHRDSSDAPLLGRIIDRHGTAALPRLFLDLKGAQNLSLFMIQWLSVHPPEKQFFELILNIEQEALSRGLKDTFVLFVDEPWIAQRKDFYDQVRSGTAPQQVSIHVSSVDIADDRVRLALRTPVPQALRMATGAGREQVFFQRQDWDWRHTFQTDRMWWEQGPSSSPTPEPGGDS